MFIGSQGYRKAAVLMYELHYRIACLFHRLFRYTDPFPSSLN